MKALSIRAPWWWYILYAGKDIENRSWATGQRGLVYLHASKSMPQAETRAEMAEAARIAGLPLAAQPTFGQLQEHAGCLVGSVEVVDCVTASESPWFFGRCGFVLRNPVAFAQPVPCKGALSWFDVPAIGEARPQAEGNLRLF